MFYQVVFDNPHFIIVDKSANVLSVPSRMGMDEKRPILGLLLERDLKMTLYPVHRLDFEVQGLIMFAKTTAAQKAANSWFEKKIVEKVYCAITRANSEFNVDENVEWKCRLLRGKKRAYESPHGKDCVTLAHLLKIDNSGYFYWQLRPVTGRSHQLRYELFRHKMPIVGDSLYGSDDLFSGEGIALRAFKIDFKKVEDREQFILPEFVSSKSF